MGTSGATLLAGYLAAVVCIPIAAIFGHGFGLSFDTHGAGLELWRWSLHSDFAGFTSGLSVPGAWSAIRLSIVVSGIVAAINSVMGMAIAWVLTHDHFRGKALISSMIDLPFALPTIVAGVTFIYLYGADSPVKLDLTGKVLGLGVALTFVTLPFCVRAVQPVLEAMDLDAQDAARTLGASKLRTFWSIVVPSILPAVASAYALAFARALGEYGSISLIALVGTASTTTASIFLFTQSTNFAFDGFTSAAAVAIVLLGVCFVVFSVAGTVGWWINKRLRP